MEKAHVDVDQRKKKKNGSGMQKNMDTIDQNKYISTEDEAQIGSYQNTEGIQCSRQSKQPSTRYGYVNHIYTLVDYTQHSLKKVLKFFKEKLIQALHKEVNQLYCRNVVEPTSPEDITK